jgi:hypothetical protein
MLCGVFFGRGAWRRSMFAAICKTQLRQKFLTFCNGWLFVTDVVGVIVTQRRID